MEDTMIRLTALYPTKANAEFDFDYYTQKHMPLVESRLKDFGCIRTEVDRGLFTADGGSAPFVCIGYVYFENLEGSKKGLEAHGEELMGDIPNYTNIEPYIQINEVI